jgi:hypothetical protein
VRRVMHLRKWPVSRAPACRCAEPCRLGLFAGITLTASGRGVSFFASGRSSGLHHQLSSILAVDEFGRSMTMIWLIGGGRQVANVAIAFASGDRPKRGATDDRGGAAKTD